MTRIAVVGAGAIGGFLAAVLARAGLAVSIVARGKHLEAIRRHGLRVESDLGSFCVGLEAADDLRKLSEVDVVLLTFKAHQWPAFLPQLESLRSRSASIVTMQNGLPFWYVREPPLQSVDPGGRIGELFGDERVIGAVVHVSGEIIEPGAIRQSGGLRYVLGDPHGGSNGHLTVLEQSLRAAGLAPEIVRQIRTTVWLKLVNNAGLNPISVLCGKTIKPMLRDPQLRGEVAGMMNEASRVGEAMGVVGAVDIDERIAYAARLNDVKTSMLQDYEQGRSLEIDPIVGAIIELAARFDVDVPMLRSAYERIKNLMPVGSAG